MQDIYILYILFALIVGYISLVIGVIIYTIIEFLVKYFCPSCDSTATV